MRFVHTADWQIGKPFAGISDAHKRSLVQQARIEAIKQVGVVAEEASLVARGHDRTLVATRLACLEVFALGGGSSADAAETSYWAVRSAPAAAITEAGKNIVSKGVLDKSAPAIAVPVVGAVSGGAVNYMFMNHFQDVARAHFAIKRLEKRCGAEAVRAAYDTLTV
jgi:hypothetical protein